MSAPLGLDADVVVVGAGAMGSAAARELAGRGAEVVLLDRFGPGHVQGASHGASRIFRLSYADPVHIGLAREAGRGWRALETETGTTLLTVTGGVSHGADPSLDVLRAGLDAAGVPNAWLSLAEAEERWPGVRIDTRALHLPESGRLHADRSVAALQTAAAARGAQVRHHTRVTSLETEGSESVRVRLEVGETLRARRVVVTAGAWTSSLLEALVPLPPLRVTQEQPAHFAPAPGGVAQDDWPSFTHRLVPGAPGAERFHGGVYGLGTPGEGVKVGFHGVGPVVDPDRRDFTARPGLAADLEAYVREWLPGLDAASAVPMSCTYTTTPDEVFVLDRVGAVVVGAGFSGHGFKFVPAIGRVLADLALGGPGPDRLFRAARFAPAR